MFGDLRNDKMRGIIPRACAHIFSHIANDDSGTEWQIKCSFMEIYMENVKDLLSGDKTSLKVRETPAKGVWVENLVEEFVTNEMEVLDLLQRGEKHRTTSATGMNETSSRSHSLFVLTVTQRLKDGSTKIGKLNLGDLAGSEKVGKTGATGTTLDEAKKINQSLSALGNCINALTKEGERGHVPYRDSKLTFILRESLGGNTKTTLIVACSPHPFNVEETISTLRFAQRAKTITNSVSVNQKRSVEELEMIVKSLMEEIAQLKRKLGAPVSSPSAAALSLDKMSEDIKAKEEESEQLMLLQYEISSVKKELVEAKAELAQAKVREEEFEAAKRKWDYDEQQYKLQLESERLVAASAAERANKVQAEKEKLASTLSAMEAQMQATIQQEQQHARSALEQLEAKSQQLSVMSEKADRLEKLSNDSARQVRELQEESSKLSSSNKTLEDQIHQLQTSQREKELVESALKQQLEDLKMGSTVSNEALSELRKESLELAKKANNASSQVESLTAALEDLKKKQQSLTKELEASKAREAQLETRLQQESEDLRAQIQMKHRELAQREAMHEEVLFRETSSAKKHLQQRETEIRSLVEKLAAARADLDDQQSKYLIQLKQQEQRNKRIHSLEEELAARNALVKELKDDVEAAVQLNIENASRFQEELAAIERKHKQAAERRKAVIVRSIVGAGAHGSPAGAAGSDGSGSGAGGGGAGGGGSDGGGPPSSALGGDSIPLSHGGAEYVSSGWFSRKMPTMDALVNASRAGWLKHQEGRLMKSWKRKWCVLNGTSLYYFENPTDQKPKGVIEMGSDCLVQKADEYTGGAECSFGLFHPGGKIFFLCADSENEREAWIQTLSDALG